MGALLGGLPVSVVLLSALVVAHPVAHAELANEGDCLAQSNLSFRGFGTLGISSFQSPSAGIVSSYSQRSAVFTAWSADLDSLLGGQVELRPTPRDSLILQSVARASYGWKPDLTLAFLDHRLDDGFRVRVGRMGSPVFRDSEVINVAYASLAVRPPLPVYMKVSAMPSIDGVDAIWRGTAGDVSIGISAHVGETSYIHRTPAPLSSAMRMLAKNERGLALSLESGFLALRISETRVRQFMQQSPATDQLLAGIHELAPVLGGVPGKEAQADAFSAYRGIPNGSPVYRSLALDWTGHDWNISSELTHADFRPMEAGTVGIVGAIRAWNITASKSLDLLTPYVFISRQRVHQPPFNSAAFSATEIPALGALDAALKQIQTGIYDWYLRANVAMNSVGIGARYDFKEHMALKVQIERTRADTLFNQTAHGSLPGPPRAAGGNLFSMSFDFAY